MDILQPDAKVEQLDIREALRKRCEADICEGAPIELKLESVTGVTPANFNVKAQELIDKFGEDASAAFGTKPPTIYVESQEYNRMYTAFNAGKAVRFIPELNEQRVKVGIGDGSQTNITCVRIAPVSSTVETTEKDVCLEHLKKTGERVVWEPAEALEGKHTTEAESVDTVEIAPEPEQSCDCVKRDFAREKKRIKENENLRQLLDTWMRERYAITFKSSRKFMAACLRNDDDLRQCYRSNVAMLLHDRYGITDYDKRNEAAEAILNLIFEDKR